MERYTYLILIAIWAFPIIIFQWLVGLDVLLNRWKIWLIGIVVPTVYLTSVDAIAIGFKTWMINPNLTTGWMIPLINVPIEEGLFFLVTNILITQSLIFLMAFPFMRRRLVTLVQYSWRLIRTGRVEGPDQP